MGVDIGIKIKAHSQEELDSQKNEVLKIIQNSPVFSHVWSFEPKSLEAQIVSLANQKMIKYSFAESCTGGLCSHRITAISGSSQTFMGSIVCYDESVKENILGVSSEIIKNYGVVSAQTAEAMARSVAIKLNTQIAISTTGFAGPTGGTSENPTGTVFIGFYIQGKVSSERFHFFGDREIVKERFAQAALFRLLELLEQCG
jgi:PncC family amidohydrolase